MNIKEVGQYWNENAEAWTNLARAGFDIYRDGFNTPAFFRMLPDVNGMQGVDIGCGEGHNTRLLAKRGASIQALDISENFIRRAREAEAAAPLGITYQVGSATELPFADARFDFATSFMCLMDIPEAELALQEAFRVLKPGGFLQFSITHPCYDTPHRKNLKDANGKPYAVEVGQYFNYRNGELNEWTFSTAPQELKAQYGNFKVPFFNRTMSQWVNAIADAGFVIEQMNEPFADAEAIAKYPGLADTLVVAYFLQTRCRKPL